MGKNIHINFLAIIKSLISDKWSLCIYSCAAGIIGVILAFCTPKVYKSMVILAPEESGNGFAGSLSSIASMVGSDLKVGQTGDALYPEIYPELMSSTEFLVDLFSVQVKTQKSHECYTYYDYMQNHQKLAFYEYPQKWAADFINAIKGGEESRHQPNPHNLTKDEDKIVSIMQKKIKCTVDKKTNVITIVVEDQDPKIAATLADSVQVHLQHAITNYRTKKARVDLDFMEKLYDEASAQYRKARQKYADFSDANRDLVSRRIKAIEDDLENEMQLKYNMYQQVVGQLQLAKAKVQERTPAFTIVQGARVPVRHAGSSKILILLIWMILGFILRIMMVVYKNRGNIFDFSLE